MNGGRGGRDIDLVVLVTALLLCLVGASLIYSVFHPSQAALEEADYRYFHRQLIWICLGLVAMFIGYAIPFRYFEALAHVFYFASVVLLVVVLFLTTRQTTHRWIPIGPLRFQPSEFAKIALLFVWGRALSGHVTWAGRLKKTLVIIGLLLPPFLLVLKQPDLGTAITYFVMLLPVLFWRGVSGYQIFLLLSPIVASILLIYSEDVKENPWPFGIYIVSIFVIAYIKRTKLRESLTLVAANIGVGLLVPSLWEGLKPYQQQRIMNFLSPESDRLGAGWQVFQSKIAIGSGGLTGKGYLRGTQKALEFLPAKHTDFIFSVLGEEIGFVGSLFVLTLFALLISRALAIACKAKSEFASTVCVGIAAYFFFQTFINVAMVSGIAPVTGIPMPFLSYGGSSLVVSCFLVGFLLNCSVRWYHY